MEKNFPLHLQEIIFGSADSGISKKISQLEKQGKIRKIAPRLYTGSLEEDVPTLIRRNLFTILGHLYPGAVISHRSALEFIPTSSNQFFLTYTYTKRVELPGLTLRLLKGKGLIEGDNKIADELYASQPPRAFLENLQTSRKSGPDSKTLSLVEIEERLEQIVRIQGEEELNTLRDRAREIAEELGMEKAFQKLNRIISALLATHPSKILTSPLALARAFGTPYDPRRYELFGELFRVLRQFEFKRFEEKNLSLTAFKNFAFYESYFSNYIEGTRFEVQEARNIIETQTPLPTRPDDSHDVLGTYQLVSNRQEMSIVPQSPEELLSILAYRHKILLSSRIHAQPGKFKTVNNYAGQTAFVEATLVRGTLMKGFEFYDALDESFARAAFMMFMVSEVHPFIDGNGRIARIMMNAELVKGHQSKIIIPTVFREDYLLTLRKLTRKGESDAYIRMLSRAHEFSAQVIGEDMLHMQDILKRSQAFTDPSEGQLKIIHVDELNF